MSLLVCAGCSTRYAEGLEACPHCRSTERAEGGGGSRLPFLDLVCRTTGCRVEGVVRRVYLRAAAPGVVEVPTYGCGPCGGLMTVVAGWPSPTGMEESMPKVTVHGGASNRHDDVPAPAEQVEGSEQPSAGSSSQTSPEKPQSSPATSETAPPSPARTTASRSKRARTGSSTAGSTAGSGEGDDE